MTAPTVNEHGARGALLGHVNEAREMNATPLLRRDGGSRTSPHELASSPTVMAGPARGIARAGSRHRHHARRVRRDASGS